MRVALVAGLVAIASLLAASDAAAQQKTTVKVGVTDRPDNAALYLAYRRGYFERQGIALEFVGGGAAAQDFVPALGLNQIQVAAGSPSAGLFNALNRGIDIRIVADWAHVGGPDDATFSLVARTDLMDSGAIRSLSDLKGKTIGIGPTHGAVNDILISEVMRQGGLALGDADLVLIGFADGLAAMSSHKLDAALLIEPLVTQAARKGIAKVLVTAGAVIPDTALALVYYSPEFASDGDLATRYMVAYLQGKRDFFDAFFALRDRDVAIAILAQDLPRVPAELWAAARPNIADLNGAVNVASLEAQAQFYKKDGEITGPIPDIDKYVDRQFAEAAVKILGRR